MYAWPVGADEHGTQEANEKLALQQKTKMRGNSHGTDIHAEEVFYSNLSPHDWRGGGQPPGPVVFWHFLQSSFSLGLVVSTSRGLKCSALYLNDVEKYHMSKNFTNNLFLHAVLRDCFAFQRGAQNKEAFGECVRHVCVLLLYLFPL